MPGVNEYYACTWDELLGVVGVLLAEVKFENPLKPRLVSSVVPQAALDAMIPTEELAGSQHLVVGMQGQRRGGSPWRRWNGGISWTCTTCKQRGPVLFLLLSTT